MPLSRRTYQARHLDAGLPESESFRREALALAERDLVRAYILRLADRPIAYLYLPVEGLTLVYAYLGYDPDYASYSPGTVLQLQALQRLFAEQRYHHFDFTEGEGAHKEMFGTASVPVCSFFLLAPTRFNRLLLRSLDLFDRTVALSKRLLGRGGLSASVRRALRS